MRYFYRVESQIKFARMTAEEDEDDGDEDDGQVGLSFLSDRAVPGPTSEGPQSDGQIDPEVEAEKGKPRDQDCHKQLQVLSWGE